MRYQPIAVKLDHMRAVVAGGGKVAERKVSNLVEAGADVLVVAPNLTAKLKRLFKKDRLRWRKSNIRKKDLRGAKIVVAATDDSRVNTDIGRWAKHREIFVNVVDNSKLSNFISPAIVRQRKALVAVYTDGKDPALSRDLKNYLKDHWDAFLSYRRRSQKSSS